MDPRRIWRCTFSTALLCMVGTVGGAAHAADQVSSDALKAAYLYRLPGYVEWPAESPNPTFTIAVLGGRSVADELERILNGQTLKARPGKVRRINSAAEVGDAQMIFIGSDQSTGTLKGAVDLLRNRPVLVVTDDSRAIGLGGTINFMQVERRIRFEVSLTAAKRAKLSISSELLAVALRVHGGSGVAQASKEAVPP